MRAFRQTASSNMGRNRTPTLADFVAANYTRDAIALAPTPRDVRPKCNPHSLRTEGKEGTEGAVEELIAKERETFSRKTERVVLELKA